MSDLSTVMFAAIKAKYFDAFYNFQSLLLNTCAEGSLETKAAVMQATKKIETELLGKREVLNLSKEDTKSTEIECMLNGFSVTEHRDGITLNFVPMFQGIENCSVCVKSNRTAVNCFKIQGAFSVDLCSQALIYGDEKYSVGVMSADRQNGLAFVAGAGDSGIKGEVQIKVIAFNAEKYIVDNAEKYLDTTALVKYVKG